MRRVLVSAVVALATIAAVPIEARAGGYGEQTQYHLVDGFTRALIGIRESDPWFFDDGCIGGDEPHAPLNVVVPATDPATTESTCSVYHGAPVVISAAGISCWRTTVHLARQECEAGWKDPAGKLLSASVIVDGRPEQLQTVRTSGKLTFPSDAALDTPGLRTPYFSINRVVILRDLKPGAHTVSVAFEYADGFAGATTFRILVGR